MATTPTRFLHKNSPLSEMTLDQFEALHGKAPIKKVYADPYERTPGGPLSGQMRVPVAVEENPENTVDTNQPNPILRAVAAQTAAEVEMKKRKKQSQPPRVRQGTLTGPAPTITDSEPLPYPPARLATNPTMIAPITGSTPTRPQPGKAHVLVQPTQPDAAPFDTRCTEIMELVFEVEGVGMVAYPLQCEVLGEHPNQPHMLPVYGVTPGNPNRELDVFVGWSDAIR